MAKTATPELFVETLTPNGNSAVGWVGVRDSSGGFIPERNAYVYMYLDGFLINPPELYPDGNYRATEFSIITDNDGYWVTKGAVFGKYGLLQMGHTLTFRAKSFGKDISDFSTPYVIGGTQTPINLGVIDDFGQLRNPYDGESTIEGSISYWLKVLTDDLTVTGAGDPNDPGLGTGNGIGIGYTRATNPIPIFNDDKTRVFIYIDGVRVGEVLKNNIEGLNARFPLTSYILGKNLSLVIDDILVNFPITYIRMSDTVSIYKGTGTAYLVDLPEGDVNLELYKNGQRLLTDADYAYTINSDHQAVVTFASTPRTSDLLSAVALLEPTFMEYEETPTPAANGIVTEFTLSKGALFDNGSTVRVFVNGLRMIEGVSADYTLDYSDTDHTKIVFTSPPLTGAVITVNYQDKSQPQKLISDYAPTQTEVYPYGNPNPWLRIMSGPAEIGFTFNLPTNFIGSTVIYKNGLKQTENVDYIYLDGSDSTIVFGYMRAYINDVDNPVITPNPIARIKPNDKVMADFNNQFLNIDNIVTALNKEFQKQENKKYFLTASVYTFNSTDQIRITSPYTLDFFTSTDDSPDVKDSIVVYDSLFGTERTLSPGKDVDGSFMFYFNVDTGRWRYTNLDSDGNIVPFIKGQHIQATALNESVLNLFAPSTNTNSDGTPPNTVDGTGTPLTGN